LARVGGRAVPGAPFARERTKGEASAAAAPCSRAGKTIMATESQQQQAPPPPQQQQQSLNLVAYVRDALAPAARRAAYASPWTCQAMLRALPALAQQHALRLLYVDGPVPEGALLFASW